MTRTEARALASVAGAACAALCLLLLPGPVKGLAALPVFAWLVVWARTGPHRARHELVDDDQADELDPLPELDDWPDVLRAAELHDADLPDPAADPIGHYSMMAARYTNSTTWEQQRADHGPHLIASAPAGVLQTPVPGPMSDDAGGPVPAVGTGEAGPPASTPPGPADTAVIDVQAAELDTWPDPAELGFDDLAERTRADFALLRRMLL
jgi:hypothetical protein